MKNLLVKLFTVCSLCVLCVILFLTCYLEGDFNEFSGGSKVNPFMVYDAATLQKVGTGTDGWTLGAHYRQTADIDLSGVANWTPIGKNSFDARLDRIFTGTYNGGGYTIANLTIDTTDDSQGLFGYVGGVVQNVHLRDVDIKGVSTVGGVVGHNYSGTVRDSSVTGNVTGSYSVGGVAGYNSGTIQNCYATSDITGGSSVGGVVGSNTDNGIVENCYATGNVIGIDNTVGGVAGYNSGTIQNCYATGSVTGEHLVGGVVGYNYNSGTVQNCYATGNVTGSSSVGGVVGSNSGTVKNCVALNLSVMSNPYIIGRILGNYFSSGLLLNNYARSDMTLTYTSGVLYTPTSNANGPDGADITSANWNSAAWWTGTARFDPDVWEITDGKLPILKNVGGEQKPVVWQHSGTVEDPFMVYDAATLQKVGTGTDGWTLDAHYLQIADIDLSGIANWKPIGEDYSHFTGTYDGGGYTIAKLTIDTTDNYQGLFMGVGDTGVVKNVCLTDVDIKVKGGNFIGGVAGYNYGTVENCYATSDITGGSSVGGVVGSNNGIVENCYATSDITGGSSVGGVVGSNNGIVENCYATGSVTGEDRVGGVAGYNYGTVENCYATGNVTGNNGGGVVGDNFGTIQNCYATGSVTGEDRVGGVVGYNYNSGTVQNCYSTGEILIKHGDGGGVAGYNYGTVENCYATGSVTGGYGGGVVEWNPDGTVKNCVALNLSVMSNPYVIGRILGNYSSSGLLLNNYARSDMTLTYNSGVPYPPTPNANGKDGADITSANWNSAAWWIGTARFDPNVWEITDGKLPILKNVGGEQKPVVQY